MLAEMERSPIASGGDIKSESAVQRERPISEFQQAKTDANISDTQAKRWQQLVQIPRIDFENKLQDPVQIVGDVKTKKSGVSEETPLVLRLNV